MVRIEYDERLLKTKLKKLKELFEEVSREYYSKICQTNPASGGKVELVYRFLHQTEVIENQISSELELIGLKEISELFQALKGVSNIILAFFNSKIDFLKEEASQNKIRNSVDDKNNIEEDTFTLSDRYSIKKSMKLSSCQPRKSYIRFKTDETVRQNASFENSSNLISPKPKKGESFTQKDLDLISQKILSDLEEGKICIQKINDIQDPFLLINLCENISQDLIKEFNLNKIDFEKIKNLELEHHLDSFSKPTELIIKINQSIQHFSKLIEETNQSTFEKKETSQINGDFDNFLKQNFNEKIFVVLTEFLRLKSTIRVKSALNGRLSKGIQINSELIKLNIGVQTGINSLAEEMDQMNEKIKALKNELEEKTKKLDDYQIQEFYSQIGKIKHINSDINSKSDDYCVNESSIQEIEPEDLSSLKKKLLEKNDFINKLQNQFLVHFSVFREIFEKLSDDFGNRSQMSKDVNKYLLSVFPLTHKISVIDFQGTQNIFRKTLGAKFIDMSMDMCEKDHFEKRLKKSTSNIKRSKIDEIGNFFNNHESRKNVRLAMSRTMMIKKPLEPGILFKKTRLICRMNYKILAQKSKIHDKCSFCGEGFKTDEDKSENNLVKKITFKKNELSSFSDLCIDLTKSKNDEKMKKSKILNRISIHGSDFGKKFEEINQKGFQPIDLKITGKGSINSFAKYDNYSSSQLLKNNIRESISEINDNRFSHQGSRLYKKSNLNKLKVLNRFDVKNELNRQDDETFYEEDNIQKVIFAHESNFLCFYSKNKKKLVKIEVHFEKQYIEIERFLNKNNIRSFELPVSSAYTLLFSAGKKKVDNIYEKNIISILNLENDYQKNTSQNQNERKHKNLISKKMEKKVEKCLKEIEFIAQSISNLSNNFRSEGDRQALMQVSKFLNYFKSLVEEKDQEEIMFNSQEKDYLENFQQKDVFSNINPELTLKIGNQQVLMAKTDDYYFNLNKNGKGQKKNYSPDLLVKNIKMKKYSLILESMNDGFETYSKDRVNQNFFDKNKKNISLNNRKQEIRFNQNPLLNIGRPTDFELNNRKMSLKSYTPIAINVDRLQKSRLKHPFVIQGICEK